MARRAHRTANTAQQDLRFRTWGGRRPGAGRPKKAGAGVAHGPRAKLPRGGAPAHVTLRARDHVWNLRSARAMRVFEAALAAVRSREDTGFRIVHFEVLGHHVHLLVEASSAERLARGMQGLSIRLARGLNRLMDRTGPVWADRYHARVLRTPQEARNALAYVLLNHRSHAARRGEKPGRGTLDPFSSAATFDGWKDAPRAPEPPRLTSPPRTWLLETGWRRRGLLSIHEVPARPG